MNARKVIEAGGRVAADQIVRGIIEAGGVIDYRVQDFADRVAKAAIVAALRELIVESGGGNDALIFRDAADAIEREDVK